MNCVTRAPILLIRSWVALSFKVCEWGSNYESLLSFRAARTTKNEKKSSLTDFSDLHLKAAPHCKASAGTWLPGWMCSWQWFVTMFHDNGSWQLFVTMVGDNGSWQWFVTMDGGDIIRMMLIVRVARRVRALQVWKKVWTIKSNCPPEPGARKKPTRAALWNDVLVRPLVEAAGLAWLGVASL